MIKHYYTIERKLPNMYVLYHNIITDTGFNFWGITSGTKEYCEKYAKEKGLKIKRSKLLW